MADKIIYKNIKVYYEYNSEGDLADTYFLYYTDPELTDMVTDEEVIKELDSLTEELLTEIYEMERYEASIEMEYKYEGF